MGNLKAFIIFITIALAIYGTINVLLYKRVMQSSGLTGSNAIILRSILLFLILAYPASRFMQGSEAAIGTFLTWVGAFWLGVMMYGIIIVILVDIIRLSDLLLGWFPTGYTWNRIMTGRIILAGSAMLILILVVGGHIRSLYPVVSEVVIETDKLPEDRDYYSIAVFSDVHLGNLVGIKRINRIIEQVNSLGVDAVLIVGDIVDESPSRLEWAIEPLQSLDAPDGVYSVLGNHEYYAGVKASADLMKRSNITLLRDSTCQVGDVLTLIGLDDVTGSQQFDKERISVKEVVADSDHDRFKILLQHTPVKLDEAVEAGVDLAFSGHTHGGQLFPANWITQRIFGVKTGLTKMGNMDFYLTAGIGTWGPPMRIGAAPEVVWVTLQKPEDSDGS